MLHLQTEDASSVRPSPFTSHIHFPKLTQYAGSYSCSPHFADEESEAQRDGITYPDR